MRRRISICMNMTSQIECLTHLIRLSVESKHLTKSPCQRSANDELIHNFVSWLSDIRTQWMESIESGFIHTDTRQNSIIIHSAGFRAFEFHNGLFIRKAKQQLMPNRVDFFSVSVSVCYAPMLTSKHNVVEKFVCLFSVCIFNEVDSVYSSICVLAEVSFLFTLLSLITFWQQSHLYLLFFFRFIVLTCHYFSVFLSLRSVKMCERAKSLQKGFVSFSHKYKANRRTHQRDTCRTHFIAYFLSFLSSSL